MKFILSFILIFCFFVSFSQESKDLTTYPGQWIYTNDNLSGEWYVEKYYSMNASELQKYRSTTEKLVNYLHQQPVAQKPLGVTLNAKARAKYDNYDHALHPVKKDEMVKAEVFIPFCSLINSNGKVEYACDEVSFVDVITNDENEVFEPAMNYDLLDDLQAAKQFTEIFYLPKKLLDLGGGVYLYDWYYKNRIVIPLNNRPIWLPITNKEYTDRLMVYYNASFKEGKIPQMVIDALKSEIDAIPPDLMNALAYLDANDERPLTAIIYGNENSTFPLYKFNPDYFDKSLPRTQVQLITITIEGKADDAEWGEINAHRVWEFIQGLKGADLKKLLDEN